HIALREKEIDRLTLRDGDILFNRTNSAELVGKCAVFHGDKLFVFASYLIRVRLDFSKADPEFVAFALNSQIGRQQIDALSRPIIGQANINTDELRSLEVPLPSLSVQKEIVKRLSKSRANIAEKLNVAEKLSDDAIRKIESLILSRS
ncbi:MAG: restriction endonuclease subunit S, partial [Xanthobacteraceae bacterium]